LQNSRTIISQVTLSKHRAILQAAGGSTEKKKKKRKKEKKIKVIKKIGAKNREGDPRGPSLSDFSGGS
jgi:hypothetical protein